MEGDFKYQDKDQLDRIEAKLDKLIPVIRDVSKYIMEAKRVVDYTSFPRRQPNKKKQVPMCGNCEGKNKVDYINKYCFRYGLCKECYKKPDSELRFPKEDYKPIKQPKKKYDVMDCTICKHQPSCIDISNMDCKRFEPKAKAFQAKV